MTIDWKSLYRSLTSQWSMLNLGRAVKFIDNDAFIEERMPHLGLFICDQLVPPDVESAKHLSYLIARFYTQMNIADRLPNVGYVRAVLSSHRFNLPDAYALVLAHLLVISSVVGATPKIASDATFLCAKVLRDEFTVFAYRVLVAHSITAAFPESLIAYLTTYIANLESMGGVLPPSW
jgi:hypothetical protein